MARSERHIRLTDAQLQQLEAAELQDQNFAEFRQQLIDKALRRVRKDTLIQLLSRLCDESIYARWCIEAELEISKPLDLILHDLREAIRLATDAGDEPVNNNLTTDWKAYAEVKRLMELLVSAGALNEAMEIAIHFMEEASHQIEGSDEGMMLEDVEECLQPVLDALENFDETQRSSWAFRMQRSDCLGVVCRERLQRWSNADRKQH